MANEGDICFEVFASVVIIWASLDPILEETFGTQLETAVSEGRLEETLVEIDSANHLVIASGDISSSPSHEPTTKPSSMPSTQTSLQPSTKSSAPSTATSTQPTQPASSAVLPQQALACITMIVVTLDLALSL